jgi:hypothetical protein
LSGATRCCAQLRFRAAKSRKATCTLALNQCLQGFPQKRTALAQTTQLSRSIQQSVVQVNGSAHGKSFVQSDVNYSII